MRTRLAFAAAVLAVASLAAGCGSDDSETSSAEEWAGSVCTAVSTWTDSLRESLGSITAGNVSEDALRSAADDAKSATDTLVDDLRGLGKPDTEAGEQAQSSVEQLADDLREQADKIESAANDASGVSGVLGAVSTVTGALGQMSTAVSSTVSDLEKLDAQGELRQAFENAAPCQDLQSSNS